MSLGESIKYLSVVAAISVLGGCEDRKPVSDLTCEEIHQRLAETMAAPCLGAMPLLCVDAKAKALLELKSASESKNCPVENHGGK